MCRYGFYQECVFKYGDATVWKYFTEVFMLMPICALIEGQIFSVHGGLSPSLASLDQIREFNRISDLDTISFYFIFYNLMINCEFRNFKNCRFLHSTVVFCSICFGPIRVRIISAGNHLLEKRALLLVVMLLISLIAKIQYY